MRALEVVIACTVFACGRVGFEDKIAGDGSSGDDGTSDTSIPSTIAFVQALATDAGTASVGQVTLPAPVIAGHTLVVAIDLNGTASIVSITDSVGTVFATNPRFPNTSFDQYIATGPITTGGMDTITVTLSNPADNFFDVRAHEYAGLAATPFVDGMLAKGGAAGPNLASATGTTTAVNQLLFAYEVCECFLSDANGTVRTSFQEDFTADAIFDAPGSFTFTSTASDGPWGIVIAILQGR